MRTALERWVAQHGGLVPSARGIRDTFRLFTLGMGLVDGVFFNWSRVLEGRSKMYFGTAEFKVIDILGRRLSLLCEGGEFKIVYDLPGPFNIVKGMPADRLKLALRRMIEAFARGAQAAALLHESELPSFSAAGLGIAEVRFSLEVSFAEPELRVKVRVTLFGQGPTVYTAHIALPKDAARYLTDPDGKVFTLIGLALFPDLDLDPLFQGHLEYRIGKAEGFLSYPRYRAFWAGTQPLGRPDAVVFVEDAALDVAWNLSSGNYSGNLFLDDGYWAYGGHGERAAAATQSYVRFARTAGALGPEFAAHPEIVIHGVAFKRGGAPIREISDVAATPIAVEVEFLSPLWMPPSAALSVNLQSIGVRERLLAAAGARVAISTAFVPAARDAGYLVEVALRSGALAETFFTTDIGAFGRAAIET